MSGRRRRSRDVVRHEVIMEDDAVGFPSAASRRRFRAIYTAKSTWPSLSDTGTDTPDCVESESGGSSSASSMFSWADDDGTKTVMEEWEKIQRTLYDEPGPKVTQRHLLDECEQWQATFPHLRIVGRKCNIHHHPSTATANRRRNQRPADRRFSVNGDAEASKTTTLPQRNRGVIDEMNAYLHVTHLETPRAVSTCRIGTSSSSSIVRSEISSSRWRQGSPEYASLPHQIPRDHRDGSAASFYSNFGKKTSSSCVLEPLMTYARASPVKSSLPVYKNRNVSLPPLKQQEARAHRTLEPDGAPLVLLNHRKSNAATLSPIGGYIHVNKVNGEKR